MNVGDVGRLALVLSLGLSKYNAVNNLTHDSDKAPRKRAMRLNEGYVSESA